MRTTISIRDDILEESKRRALDRHTTLGAFIEDVLRVALLRPQATQDHSYAVRLKTFRGQGLRPGVDLDHSDALMDVMEDR